MSEIHRKARICPRCRSSISFSGSVKGFLKTGAWMIAAIISFGFAAFEKAEKYGYSTQLKQVATDLDLANMTTSVLQSQLKDPSAPPPPLLESGEFAQGGGELMMRAAPGSGEVAADDGELVRLEQRIKEELGKSPRNEALLKKLIRRQQYLKTMN